MRHSSEIRVLGKVMLLECDYVQEMVISLVEIGFYGMYKYGINGR